MKKTTKNKPAVKKARAPRRPLAIVLPPEVTSDGETTITLVADASDLTDKQARFIAEYLVDLNAAAAARRAGYSAASADQQGYENLRKPEIAAAVAAGKARQLEQAELTGQMVIDRLRLLGFQDIRKLFDATGNLVAIHQLSEASAATIGGIEVIIKNAKAGDGVTDLVHKIKIIDPVEPLALLAKRFGLLKDVVEHRLSLEDLVAGSRTKP